MSNLRILLLRRSLHIRTAKKEHLRKRKQQKVNKMSWNFETPGDLLYETTDNFYATKSMRSHVSHLAARAG